MGIFPALSVAIFDSSLSTQMTSFPFSARQAPTTSPTYPVPTTAIFIVYLGWSRPHACADPSPTRDTRSHALLVGRLRPQETAEIPVVNPHESRYEEPVPPCGDGRLGWRQNITTTC